MPRIDTGRVRAREAVANVAASGRQSGSLRRRDLKSSPTLARNSRIQRQRPKAHWARSLQAELVRFERAYMSTYGHSKERRKRHWSGPRQRTCRPLCRISPPVGVSARARLTNSAKSRRGFAASTKMPQGPLGLRLASGEGSETQLVVSRRGRCGPGWVDVGRCGSDSRRFLAARHRYVR